MSDRAASDDQARIGASVDLTRSTHYQILRKMVGRALDGKSYPVLSGMQTRAAREATEWAIDRIERHELRTDYAAPDDELAAVCEERDRARRDRDYWRAEAEKARSTDCPTAQQIAAWLRSYAEKQSGSHPANAGYIACNAAASAIERGEWRSTDHAVETRGHRINRKATIGARIVELDLLIAQVEKRSRKTPPKTLTAEIRGVEQAKKMLPALMRERDALMEERVTLEAIEATEAQKGSGQ